MTLTIERIIDFDPFALPMSLIYPAHQMAEVAAHRAVLEPDHLDFDRDMVLLGMQSHILRAGGLTILIDTCVGACKERPRRAEWHRLDGVEYLQGLARAGYRPEDIDIVLCTHLHADHVGWNTRLESGRWVPTFPNARYLVGAAELAHWQAEEAAAPGQHNHGAYADSVLPILEAGLLDPVAEGFSLRAGMDLIGLPGHSPGQLGLHITRAGQAPVCFCGDAFHTVAQVFAPHWSSRFCHDAVLGQQTRNGLLQRCRDEGLILIPAHLRRHLGFTSTGPGRLTLLDALG